MIEAGKYCDTEIDLAPQVEYLSDAETKVRCRTFAREDGFSPRGGRDSAPLTLRSPISAL